MHADFSSDHLNPSRLPSSPSPSSRREKLVGHEEVRFLTSHRRRGRRRPGLSQYLRDHPGHQTNRAWQSKAQFFSRAGYRLTLGRPRYILSSLHQQHTRRSAPIDRAGLDSSTRSLPRSVVLRSTRLNSDDAGPHVRTAVGDSGVCTAFPMHDAPACGTAPGGAKTQLHWEDGSGEFQRPLIHVSQSKAQFLFPAAYGLTLGRRRNVLASLHQQHTRSSVPIDKGGLDSSFRSLPRSLVLWSTRPNSDDGEPHVRAAVGYSGVSTTFPMHDAPVVHHLEASTLDYTRKTALSKAHFLSRAGYRLTLGHQRNILASLHQQHTRSSAPIDRGGWDNSIRSLPRSVVIRSTRLNRDDAVPHVRTAVGDSGVCAAFPMHDAPVVQRLEAPMLDYTRKTALGHVLVRASPTLYALHVLAAQLAVPPDMTWAQRAVTG
ncbi:hypothetical protein MRX96_000991 [Rhipicephalus microplus]